VVLVESLGSWADTTRDLSESGFGKRTVNGRREGEHGSSAVRPYIAAHGPNGARRVRMSACQCRRSSSPLGIVRNHVDRGSASAGA
jgi:hypothetical protein